tara:strand:+ start:1841 stop:2638 length:798 start_codon:yes stop_codon:yes gene_type:complete
MAEFSRIEKRKLEKDLGMSSGYILNFPNCSFEDFMFDTVGIEIYDQKYDFKSCSKANRMRAFWDLESDFQVAKVLEALIENWEEYSGYGSQSPSDDFIQIAQRLKASAPVPDISSIRPNVKDKGFEALAQAVRTSIENNEPQAGLDRLHTFLVKYFRTLCVKHEKDLGRDKPLHSLVGEYIKAIKTKGLIESEITERILKSTISVMEAFNNVRNNHSYAHDNEVLNYNESLLIFGHVTSSIRFIESVERVKTLKVEIALDDDMPV